MVDIAYAMGQGAGAGAGQGGSFSAFVPLILMFVIFYFLLIRPQQKKQKEHQNMINSLKKGDRVVTSGGIYGTVVSIDNDVIGVEIADKVKIKIMRGNIAMLDKPGAGPKAAKKNKDDGAKEK